MTIQHAIDETARRLNNALEQVEDTRQVRIGDGILAQTGEVFRDCFDEKNVVLIADKNTFQVAGRAVQDHLRGGGFLEVEEPLILQDDDFHADAAHLETVRQFLSETSAIPLAVGSGTINDLVKASSFRCGRSYMVVGTAASMDGYTSFGASVDVDGFKQTLTCPAPRAVLIDLDVACRAPQEMTAAGYADLIAKIPAGADWMLADRIGSEPIHRAAWGLVQDHLRHWLSDPEGVTRNDKATLCHLSEGLVMSGLAMQLARTSRTASGAEHMFSHLWDNQNHLYRGKTPSHGFKVGIGTFASSLLYESVLELTEDDLRSAKDRVERYFPSWEEIVRQIRDTFGETSLAAQVTEQSRQKFVDVPEIRRRLDVYLEDWPGFKQDLQRQLLPARSIRDMLRKAGAPARSEDIGIDRERYRRSFGQARLIRCRYNVLDFCLEVGQWGLVDTLDFDDNR